MIPLEVLMAPVVVMPKRTLPLVLSSRTYWVVWTET